MCSNAVRVLIIYGNQDFPFSDSLIIYFILVVDDKAHATETNEAVRIAIRIQRATN